MASYYVELPIAGSISVYIEEAESEKDAIQKAKAVDWNTCIIESDTRDIELGELDICDPICRGNIVYAPTCESSAILEEED